MAPKKARFKGIRDVGYWHIASFRCAAKLGRYWRHSGHCSALAHIANSGIFPAQSLKQDTKCRNSTKQYRHGEPPSFAMLNQSRADLEISKESRFLELGINR